MYLRTLTTDELWGLPADEVVRRDVAQKVMAIDGLRGANAAKVRLIKTGLRFQLGGVALLAATMGLELWTRLR